MGSMCQFLCDKVQNLVSRSPFISRKRMFGCDAFFANDAIFALIWKEGRVGIKLTTLPHYEQLMAMPGAEQWKAGNKAMSHWVLVPETFHDEDEALMLWLMRAHQDALSAPPKKSTAKSAPRTKAQK